MQNFDPLLAYKAMFRYLGKYYALSKSDEIGTLLASMNLEIFEGGKPAAPALWDDWLEAIHEVFAEQGQQPV
ncbi:MAG TPA: hypothetical protein VF774_25760 [Pseudoduganella sp.]